MIGVLKATCQLTSGDKSRYRSQDNSVSLIVKSSQIAEVKPINH